LVALWRCTNTRRGLEFCFRKLKLFGS
jgi:hypothetical protein